ncbi:iron-containing alcohol dehydrogenase [Enterococcus dongliensis]|uniref:iron-containing alcohol dehydrogenase n=1 Tax=Enterococcus dongliensis TaxID=2559925 RepID=UPI00288E3CD7|nr:iron-containing alcohol dehydrogenase [Enterococcus dongliensis]MDT2674583.1 iron-containing alcohol dehydrogenase [Enterococcus dongliensis]
MNIQLKMPANLIIGGGTIQNLFEESKQLGENPLIISDTVMQQTGHLKRIEALLGKTSIQLAEYTDIQAEPTQENVYAALQLFQKNQCDHIIAFGGGSCLDTAKVVAVLAANQLSLEALYEKRYDLLQPSIPLIALPTTAGTGSEVTNVAVITNTKTAVKMMMKDLIFMPQLSIVDADFTLTVPAKVTAATGIDALCHALESYVSVKANEVTRLFSLEAMKKIMNVLSVVYENGQDSLAREQMSLASTEAGLAFSNASVTLIHGMSRPLGALFHIPHGISNAMLLPVFLEFSKDAIKEDLSTIAKYIYPTAEELSVEDSSLLLIEKIQTLCQQLAIPTIKNYGVDQRQFFVAIDKMATDALASGSPQNNKKVPNHGQIKDLYIQAYG